MGEEAKVRGEADRKVTMQSLGAFGAQLAMRPQGRRVQEALDTLLRRLPAGGVLIVDFDGVEMMDYSFADEALGTLFSRMAAREYPDRYLILAARDDELGAALMENVEVALARREVAALVVPDQQVRETAARSETELDAAFEWEEVTSDEAPDTRPIKWKVIGQLPDHLVDTLSAIMAKEQVTVRDLVEALDLDSATACNNRVAKLYQLHLVRRKAAVVPEGGRQYCYSSVV